MIKYKLKNSHISLDSNDFLKDYLSGLGVSKPESFIYEPSFEDQESFRGLDNIDEVVELLYKGFKEQRKFFIQVDSDVDGFTSSSIFYSFFKRLFPDAIIRYRLHEGKEHGVIVDTVPIDTDYVIIPDAGSMQWDEQEELSRKGYTVIILDHHNLPQNYPRFENVHIVNNQSSENFKNKDLSGAGVVYKVVQAFNSIYSSEFPTIYSDYADLAALGLVADMMDTRNLDNNYIIHKGLNNIKNSMLRALLEKQSFSIKDITKPTKIDLAFYIAPLINGVIRVGDQEEKDRLFKGFITHNSDEVVITHYRGVERTETYYDYVARLAVNTRARQNKEKEKCMNFLSERIEKENLHSNQVLIVVASKDDPVVVPQTITGLVAMELLKKYKKPTLVLRPKTEDKKNYFAGSGRGKQNGHFTTFFGFLEESGLCEYVAGHDMAFGTSVEEDNLPKLIEYANEKLNDIEFDIDEVEVDFVFENGNINNKMLWQFGKAIHIYGNGIPQPKFAFELEIPRSAINLIGGNKDTLKFSVNGVDFIKFKDKDLAEKISTSESYRFKITAIGRAQTNEWMGRSTPQIMIDEIELEEKKLENLF